MGQGRQERKGTKRRMLVLGTGWNLVALILSDLLRQLSVGKNANRNVKTTATAKTDLLLRDIRNEQRESKFAMFPQSSNISLNHHNHFLARKACGEVMQTHTS